MFFRFSLPLEGGLRRPSSGLWLFGNAGSPSGYRLLLAVVVCGAIGVLVIALGLCLARGGRCAAIALALLAFPFVYAASPATWYWQDGRYVGFLGPLVAMLIAVGCVEAAARVRRRSAAHTRPRAAGEGRIAMAAITLVALACSSVALYRATHGAGAASYVSSGNPDGPTLAAIASLEAHGVRTGTADYWVAYKVDFLSDGHLKLTTAGSDVDRWKALDAAVRHSAHPAWIFVPASQMATGWVQFGFTDYIAGPDGVSESTVEKALRRLGVSYQVVDAGTLQALVPSRPVSISRVASTG